MNLTEMINQVKDSATRRALQMIFDQLKDDLNANKAAFDGHDHDGTADQSPINSSGEAVTFTNNLN